MVKGIKKLEIAESDGVLDLRDREKGNPAFKVSKINESIDQTNDDSTLLIDNEARRISTADVNQKMENFAEKLEHAVIKVTAKSPQEKIEEKPVSNLKDQAKDLIKVKFEKFVQLVATRNFVDVLEKNKNEDLIMSSNLLTDLAGAMEEKTEKKTPIIFLVGLALGIALTYLLFNH